MDFRKEGLILVNITVNYLNPIKLYDSIEVRTKVVGWGNKSLEMLQQVYNLTSKSVAAESKGIMVGFCGDENTTIAIPERWKKKILEFERDIDCKL
jgi:acyl-CoA thioesterase FadM